MTFATGSGNLAATNLSASVGNGAFTSTAGLVVGEGVGVVVAGVENSLAISGVNWRALLPSS